MTAKKKTKTSEEFDRFETFVKKIVKVPKAEIAKREAAEQKAKEKLAKKKA